MHGAVAGVTTSTNIPTRAKRRILVIGQAVHPTGYARVLHSIAEQLKDQFEIVHFGINYRGEQLDCGWQIWPNQLVGDILGYKALPRLLDQFHPDLVFICHDSSLYKVHQPTLLKYRQSTRVVFYCPVEWPFVEPTGATSFSTLDRLVVYTNYGLRQVQTAFQQAQTKGETLVLPPTSVIPHGVDTTRFYPLYGPTVAQLQENRHLARTLLFPERPELRDSFIVLNANRNCRRKRIDLTLRAFAEFAQSRDDTWLYLHMGMIDRGVDVLALARELGVADRLLLTTSSAEKPAISDQQLNLIYNACDVGLNTSVGEGWGLVAFEHAATGAAQIVPDHSACAELWQGIGLVAPLVSSSSDQSAPSWSGTISIAAVATLLTQLYQHRQLLAEYQQRAVAYASSPQFNWKNIASQWAQIFTSLLAQPTF